MPLVVPGVMTSSGGNQQDSWMSKLMGKKITDSTTDATSFSKQDLPKDHRIVEPGSMSTTDHNPDRLNIHVGEDGIVKHVEFK